MGEKPMGIIMYTPDGFMSAQLMRPDRSPFASGDLFDGTAEEYREEASTYIAYSGPFHVDEQKKTLTHSMFVSLFPNWTGQTQPGNAAKRPFFVRFVTHPLLNLWNLVVFLRQF